MRITCELDYGMVMCDHTDESVTATCSRCGHETESCGSSEESIRRCLVMMREECPLGESNWYEGED